MDKNGTTGEVQQMWSDADGREAAEKVMGEVPKREKKNESQSEKRMPSRRSTADRVTPTSVRKSERSQCLRGWSERVSPRVAAVGMRVTAHLHPREAGALGGGAIESRRTSGVRRKLYQLCAADGA
jgi:hypothetical protein